MKINDKAYVRYRQIVILQYFPEYNTFKAAQVDTTGGYVRNNVFYFPGGVLGVEPNIHYPSIETRNMICDSESGIWADEWIGQIPYHIQVSDDYDSSGWYYLYPLKPGKNLKTNSINEAVDFTAQPILRKADPEYLTEQDGYALQGETIAGSFLKGRIIIIYGKAPRMSPKYFTEVTPEILQNQFMTLYCVMETDEGFWVHFKCSTVHFVNQNQ